MEDKIEQFWRDATADDVAEIMRTGKPLEARYRDEDDKEWRDGGELIGWCFDDEWRNAWMDEGMVAWQQCQVYDPPQWWLDKPDPGEGYRLLEKFPPEGLQEGDECYNPDDNQWSESANARPPFLKQSDRLWYRRRIEANNPEIPDSSNSSETPNSCRFRDTIPSGWLALGKDEERLASDAYWSQSAKDWVVIGDDRVTIANDLPKWHAIRRVLIGNEHNLVDGHRLVDGYHYHLPNGQTIRITAKGFEVATD